jgi:hypothetical protein
MPLPNKLLADKLHSHIEIEQDQATENRVLREEDTLFGRGPILFSLKRT